MSKGDTRVAMDAPSRCARPPTVQYRPGAWEAKWRSTFARSVQHDDPRNWTRGCALMASEPSAIEAWLDFARLRRPPYRMGRSPPEPTDEAKGVLSYHATVDACTGRTLSLAPIEPLVGFLRHPEAHCPQFPGAKHWVIKVLSKDYLIPAWHAEAWPAGRTRALFFDLGASLYHTGGGGASISWFVNQYRARGISFDRLFAWEAKQYTDATIYATMPASIVDRIAYYNLPANTTPGNKHNPWRTLRAVATPNDFVVVKVDVVAVHRLAIFEEGALTTEQNLDHNGRHMKHNYTYTRIIPITHIRTFTRTTHPHACRHTHTHTHTRARVRNTYEYNNPLGCLKAPLWSLH